MIDLTPKPHVLLSWMNTPMPWWQALAELIDNAFEAGATRVEIQQDKRILRVIDDGRGVPDITACFRLGDHRENDPDGIGQYGIGVKSVWTSMASMMRVSTVRNGIRTVAEADCMAMARSGLSSLEMADPISIPTNDPSGTVIELHLREGKNMPSDDAIGSVRWAFTPALRTGLQIVHVKKGRGYGREPMAAMTLPTLDDVVDSEFEIDGKSVRIHIGIIVEGQKMVKGPLWLIRKHRIIDGTSIGIADRYSARRIGGEIHIGKEWNLSKHKDALTENSDRLSEAIYVRIRHILEKADALADTFESAALRNEIQAMLDQSISTAQERRKEQRSKGNTHGTVEPKNTGRERLRAANVSGRPGKIAVAACSGSNSKRGIAFDWIELDDDRLGHVDATGRRVSLNLSNPYIATLHKQSNSTASYLCVAALIADYDCRHTNTGQKLLSFDMGDFSRSMGFIIRDRQEEKTHVEQRA